MKHKNIGIILLMVLVAIIIFKYKNKKVETFVDGKPEQKTSRVTKNTEFEKGLKKANKWVNGLFK